MKKHDIALLAFALLLAGGLIGYSNYAAKQRDDTTYAWQRIDTMLVVEGQNKKAVTFVNCPKDDEGVPEWHFGIILNEASFKKGETADVEFMLDSHVKVQAAFEAKKDGGQVRLYTSPGLTALIESLREAEKFSAAAGPHKDVFTLKGFDRGIRTLESKRRCGPLQTASS